MHYRFPTGLNDGNLSRGDQLLDADIEPRSEGLEPLRFRDPQTGIIRVLALNDPFPTAEELFQINDAEQNWCANTSRARCQLFQNNPAQLNFVGQIALATSYGLLQVLYETAVADMRWPGIGTGAQNPSYLFDTTDIRNLGGGSLPVGTRYVGRKYRQANPQLNQQQPAFLNLSDFENSFLLAFQRYNRRAGYATEVLARVPRFAPLARTIFR
ncbi:MAG: hypothetical protein ACRD5W_06710 [Candidatus Acidiferrales bacterium]